MPGRETRGTTRLDTRRSDTRSLLLCGGETGGFYGLVAFFPQLEGDVPHEKVAGLALSPAR
ncbi:MAG: hypothetical protein GXP36_03605 [Actinobacteria bacterium]|nr:hypothetical protein [Actinomycetota bacterium]